MTEQAPPEARRLRIAMLGPFGLHPKATMLARAAPAARALVQQGHTVTIVMPPWHTPELADRRWEADGVEYRYVSLKGLALPGLGHLAVATRMVGQARQVGADVLHAFKPKAYSGLAASIARVAGGPPVVVDTDDWEGPGGWNDLEPYGRLMRRFFAWQERHGLTTAAGVTVASRALETVVLSFGVSPDRITYLPNAVEALPDRSSGELGAAGRLRILLYTRFFEFPVGQPLDVLAALRAGGIDATLVVVGKGLFGEEADLIATARERGLEGAVEYLGWLDSDQRRAVFCGVDAAIYPFSDTLINRTKSSAKLLEIMAWGIPVVAEAVGETALVIESGRSGLLVPPGDTTALVAALSELAERPDLRRALGDGARERIGRDYLWRGRVSELVARYRRAIDVRPP